MPDLELQAKTREVLERAVEEGVVRGLHRARKHHDAPSDEVLREHLEREVMQAIGEVFRLDEEASDVG